MKLNPNHLLKIPGLTFWSIMLLLVLGGTPLQAQDSPFPNEGKEQFYYFDHPALIEAFELIKLKRFDDAERVLRAKVSATAYDGDRAWLLPLGLMHIYFEKQTYDELKAATDELMAFVDKQSVQNNVLKAYGQLMLNDYWLYYNRNDSAVYYVDRSLESYLEGPYQDVITYKSLLHVKFRTYENEVNTEDSLLKYCDIQRDIYDNHYERIAKHEPAIQKSLLFKRYASVYSRLGDYSKAISYLYEALRLIEQDPEQMLEKEKYAYAKLELMVAFYSTNQFPQAKKYAKEVVAHFEEFLEPGHYNLIDAYNALAVTYTALDQPDSALIWLDKCLEITAKYNGMEGLDAYIMLNMGASYTQSGNEAKSQELLGDALKTRQTIFGKRHPGLVDFYRYMAESHSAFNNHQLAVEALDSALLSLLPDLKTVEDITTLNFDNLSLDVLDLIEFYLQELVAVRKDNNASPESTRIILDLATLMEQALEAKKKDYYETESVLSNARLYKDVFEHALVEIALLNAEEGPMMDQAAQLMYTSKNIILNSEIKEFTLINDPKIPDLLRKEYLNNKQQLQQLDNQLTNIIATTLDKDSINLLNTEKLKVRSLFQSTSDSLRNSYWPERESDTNLQSLDKIRADHGLTEETALIEYFYGDYDIVIMGISANKSVIKRIPNNSELRQRLSDFIDSGSMRPQGKSSAMAYSQEAKYFYDLLLAPVMASLGTDLNQLIIIPDGTLSFLSFELLSTNESDAFDNINYLINDYRIAYAYSSKKPVKQANQYGNKGLLAFGFSSEDAPAIEREALGDLPGAEQEVDYLKSKFKGSYFLGKKGTKARFMDNSEDYDILHLALHGRADTLDRYNSRLIFNGESDYEFNSFDLFALNLNPSMVVLSACETSGGKLDKGEGVFSVARSFATKGVPSIVTTLWKVNDLAGADIITGFYDNLEKGMYKDEAIRQAKLSYLKKADNLTSHPYYWGSFIVMGDTDPIDIKKASSFSWYWLLALVGVLFILSRLGKQPSGKPKW